MGSIGRRRDGASLGWRPRCALAALALAAGQALGLLAPTVAAAATASSYTDGQTVYVDPTDTHVEAMWGDIHVVRGTGDLALCVEPGVKGQSGQRTAHNLVGKITNCKNGNTSRYWDQEGVTLAALAVDYYLNHSGLAYADAVGQAQLTVWHFAKWGDLNMGDAGLTAYVNANKSQYVGCAWLFETTADQSSATFWLEPATGKGKLRKVSANTAMTDGSPCFSLAGAVYGVYLDAQYQQQNRVAELVTDEQGDTSAAELSPGTYFVKEEKASKGYALCGETHRLTVTAGQTSTVECAETLQNDPNLMKVQKVDSAIGEAVAQGDATLAGAEITLWNKSAASVVIGGETGEPNCAYSKASVTDMRCFLLLIRRTPQVLLLFEFASLFSGYTTIEAARLARVDGEVIMAAVKFFRCSHCGNVVAVLVDGGAVPVCCGEPMRLLRAGTTDGAHEKHVPAVTREGDELSVQVGSVEHPMLPEHHIQLIAVSCGKRLQVARLLPGESPAATFHVPAGKPVTVYELCNLHGLWSAEA